MYNENEEIVKVQKEIDSIVRSIESTIKSFNEKGYIPKVIHAPMRLVDIDNRIGGNVNDFMDYACESMSVEQAFYYKEGLIHVI